MNLEDKTMPLPITGCRIWLGSTSAGYGTFRKAGRTVYVHREVLSAKEPPPFPGAFALHSCDVKCCCEETHLHWGNHRRNMQEASKRGRLSAAPRTLGEKVNTAKLTEDDVRSIRSSALSNQEIDRKFGLSPGRAWRIRARKSWRYVA